MIRIGDENWINKSSDYIQVYHVGNQTPVKISSSIMLNMEKVARYQLADSHSPKPKPLINKSPKGTMKRRTLQCLNSLGSGAASARANKSLAREITTEYLSSKKVNFFQPSSSPLRPTKAGNSCFVPARWPAFFVFVFLFWSGHHYFIIYLRFSSRSHLLLLRTRLVNVQREASKREPCPNPMSPRISTIWLRS